MLDYVNEGLPWLEKFETNIAIFGLFKIHIGNNYHDVGTLLYYVCSIPVVGKI